MIQDNYEKIESNKLKINVLRQGLRTMLMKKRPIGVSMAIVYKRAPEHAEVPRQRLRELPPVGRAAAADVRSAKFRQNVARFQLYRHQFLQENMRFAAFFKIYPII